MLPEKFTKDMESSRRRRKIFRHLSVSAVFLTFFLIIGALIHEISHIAVLEWKNCPHRITWRFSFLDGLTAQVKPLCSPNKATLTLFYSIGYSSTLIAGALSMIASLESSKIRVKRYLSAASTGMLLSVLLSIGTKGDVRRLLRTLGVETLELPVIIFVVLGVFISSLKGAEMLLELERQE